MVSTSKKDSTQSSKGGEASANYMIRGAGRRSKVTTSKSSQKKNNVVGKLKKKVKDVKDKVVDTADKATTATTRKVRSTTNNSANNRGKKYEQGSTGTGLHKISDPTKEYKTNEPMSPAKIKQHKPTAVRRNPSDQKIIDSE